jgi:hypothetical protein
MLWLFIPVEVVQRDTTHTVQSCDFYVNKLGMGLVMVIQERRGTLRLENPSPCVDSLLEI